MSIPSTRPFLPDRETLNTYLDRIYASGWLTNNGPLVDELTNRLEERFSTEHILLVANGTLALQVAYRTLLQPSDFEQQAAEAITTPFTFIATSNSLQWEGISPVFSDISSSNWCIDPEKIEEKITKQTKLIVPVHVFGNVCEIEKIAQIAKKNNLKTIYDASHSFDIDYSGESIVQFGDATVISFHATKLFHTVEGAMIRFKRKSDFDKAKEIANFGFNPQKEPVRLGINAKMNEFEAACGLATLDDITKIVQERKKIADEYQAHLSNNPNILKLNRTSNNAYVPVLFKSEATLLRTLDSLASHRIEAKRYFYPSLDTVEHLSGTRECTISQDISDKILCLPIFSGLEKRDVKKICDIINSVENTRW